MQARPIRRGPSSSSLSADPQGGRQAPLTEELKPGLGAPAHPRLRGEQRPGLRRDAEGVRPRGPFLTPCPPLPTAWPRRQPLTRWKEHDAYQKALDRKRRLTPTLRVG